MMGDSGRARCRKAQPPPVAEIRAKVMTDPIRTREFAIQTTRKLQAAGYEALWAGGCVRDQLLGLQPKDYDIATSATPEQVREVFGRRRTLAIGQAFGVISVLGGPAAGQIDVATFRSDGQYLDGRHPSSVTFGDAKRDALRRDFTINGIFYDPIREQIIDYVDGQTDLQAGLIRAIGNPAERIGEDRLRMLRAVRFAARFAFQLDQQTQDAIRDSAGQVYSISGERIGNEMRLLLCGPNRDQAMPLLRSTGLLAALLPEWPLAPERIDRVGTLLQMLQTDEFPTLLAAVALGLGGDSRQLKSLASRWKLSNRERDSSVWICENVESLGSADRLPFSRIQRQLIQPDAPAAVELGLAWAQVFQGDAAGYRWCQSRLSEGEELLNPSPLIDGSDLISMGIQPGPEVGRILYRTRDEQLDGKLHNRAQALDYARLIAKIEVENPPPGQNPIGRSESESEF